MKKVLIISYYWPPSGGIGVLRCLKIVKYLREFGWEPIVFAPKNADYPYLDENNSKDIPKDITVIRFPILEPFKLFKFITNRKNIPLNNIVHVRDKQSVFDKLGIWIRGNFFIPDARCLWINPSVKFLSTYLKDHQIDAIFTDGPPHTNTVIGTRLAKKLGIPYLADFQDPWTQVDYYKYFKIGKRADKIHKELEQETFRTASKITVASPSWKSDLETIGAKNVDVLYYGYDEDDFKNIETKPDENFTLCHAGLLGFDRNPDNLFQVISELVDENDLFKRFVRIKILGQIDFKVLETLKTYNLEEFTINLGTVKRQNALQEISNSWMLFLPLNKADNVNGRIPGKLFEYIRSRRPIISIGPDTTDVSNLIHTYKLGINVNWDDKIRLKEFILSYFNDFYAKKIFFNESINVDFTTFSNYNQTKKLAEFLDKMIINKL